MYKLIIVEDESLVRKILCKKIEWNKMGFELTNNFENGADALSFLQLHHVDVILTDIHMPFATGLDISKYVYENKLSTEIVFISGYRDFEYAKKAMEHGVKRYLLKPVKIEEIRKVFLELKETLDNKLQEINQTTLLTRKYNELVQYSKKQILINWLYISAAGNDTDEEPELLYMQWTAYMPVIVRIEHYYDYIENKWRHGKENLEQAIENIISQSVDNYESFVMTSIGDDSFLFLINPEETDPETVTRKIIASGDILGLKLNIYKGKVLSSKNMLADEFNAMQRKTYGNSPHELHFSLEAEKLMISFLNTSDMANALKTLDSLFLSLEKNIRGIKGKRQVKLHINRFCSELMIGINRYLMSLKTDIETVTGKNTDIDFNFVSLGGLPEIKEFFKSIINNIVSYNTRNNKNSDEKIMSFITEYINKNIDKDISLSSIASLVYLHPVYLSRFFKKNTGENFKDFVIFIKMEKAKELLKNLNLKIKDIGFATGYKNTQYFLKTFKNYTGVTPSEYREKLADKGIETL